MLMVQKYGGTSLGDVQRVRAAAKRITDLTRQGIRMVVVVSAQADTTDVMIEKAAAVNKRGAAREMDAFLSAGEQMSAALMAMASSEAISRPIRIPSWRCVRQRTISTAATMQRRSMR